MKKNESTLFEALQCLEDDLLDATFPETSVDQELVAMGIDPVALANRGSKFVASLKQQISTPVRERHQSLTLQIEPTHGSPWPYGPPHHLEAPPLHQGFNSFVERLRRFARDGILDIGSRVLWYPWEHGISSGERGFAVTEMFGPDVIGLAMMFCPAEGQDPFETDFRHLCWELFELGSFSEFDSDAAMEERCRIVNRWDNLLAKTPFRAVLSGANANYARGLWMRGRMVASDLLMLPSIHEIGARILLLHEALEAEAPRPQVFRDYRAAYFQNDVRAVLLHALGLIGFATKNDQSTPRCPGRFDVFRKDEENPEVIAFTQFAKLACLPASEFPLLRDRLMQMPEDQRKLSPEARPLSRQPGIHLEWGDRRAFSYPSPRRLLRALHRLFIDDFIEFLSSDADFKERAGIPPTSLLGNATHRYLSDSVSGSSVVAVDDSACPVAGKKPDAVWCGHRFGVIFEAKTRVTPRTDPELCSPDSMLEAWRRCWEAVEQASEFVADERARRWMVSLTDHAPSKWVLAIVVDEDLVAERTSFRHATSHWNLLADTTLCGLAVISFKCLEEAASQLSPDVFGEIIETAWLRAGLDGLQQPPEEPTFETTTRPKPLDDAFKRLLGDP